MGKPGGFKQVIRGTYRHIPSNLGNKWKCDYGQVMDICGEVQPGDVPNNGLLVGTCALMKGEFHRYYGGKVGTLKGSFTGTSSKDNVFSVTLCGT